MSKILVETSDNCFWVIFEKHKLSCTKCHGELVSTHTLIARRDGQVRKVLNKRCVHCGLKHLPYGTYITALNRSNIVALNPEDIQRFISRQQEQVPVSKIPSAKKKAVSTKKTKEKYNPYAMHSSERSPIEYEGRVQSNSINYCMCVLKDLSDNSTFKATVTNGSEILILKDGERIYPSGSAFGTECLRAVANDKGSFDYDGVTYKMIRYVRYDAQYVDAYALKKPEGVGSIKQHSASYSKERTDDISISSRNRALVDAREDIKDVFVYYKLMTASCVANNHNIEAVTLITRSLTNAREVRINAYHCKRCDRFFVNNDAVKELLTGRQYPVVRFQIVGDLYGSLRNESELTLYGYNVREGGLTDSQRHHLLAMLIDQGLLLRHDIIKTLQFNIDFIGKKANMDRAKRKWSDDISFVSSYIKGNSKIIRGNLWR